MPEQRHTGLEPVVPVEPPAGLAPVLVSKRKNRTGKPTKLRSEMTTEELIKLIGDETERYWKLSNKLTVRQSYKTEGRKDLEKLKECHRLWSEVLSRPSEEYLKAQVLLSDPRPGVRLSAATELMDVAFDAVVEPFKELAKRNLGPDGYADPYGARARGWLSNLAREGRVTWQEETYEEPAPDETRKLDEPVQDFIWKQLRGGR